MKTNQVTGMLRRLDELGRIVIPKEYRRALHLSEEDPLEVILCDHQIIIHKYHPLKTIQSLCQQYLRAYAQNCNVPCVICNSDNLLAVRGVSLSPTARLSDDVRSYISKNQIYHFDKDNNLYLLGDRNYPIDSIYPVVYDNKPVGAVILLHYRPLTDTEMGYAKFLSDLLTQAIKEEG